MIGPWLAVALLAGSWLVGLGYLQAPQWIAWAVVLALGTLRLAGTPWRWPRRAEMAVAALLCVPAVIFLPWPYRAAPLALAAGLVLPLASIPRAWSGPLGRGLAASGLVLLAQGAAIAAYSAWTARAHDLPRPLVSLAGGVMSLVGADGAVDGTELAIHSLRHVHRLPVTWELLVDPASVLFLVGGLALLAFVAHSERSDPPRWKPWLQRAAALALGVAVWLPVRAGLLAATVVHRAARTDAAERLNLLDQFLSPWVSVALVVPEALFAWRLVRLPLPAVAEEADASPATPSPRTWRSAGALGLVVLAGAIVAFAWQWSPVGDRQGGRVMVVERHSTWEPTDRRYDTESYGEEASYTYGAIYDYCGQFYTMSRLGRDEPIDADRLRQCDVLVIKTITERYAPDEVQAVREFVEQGGALLLIAEHTDRRIQTPYANDLASQFGFKFRQDLLFRVGNPYEQTYQVPRVPHPIVQDLPPTVFAVSCSIDPGVSAGTAVVRDRALWSLAPDYHADNYFPEAELRAEGRFGPFIQLWAATYGRGRVVAWTDSTIFSNFCTFEPGKAELMLGMLEWLNHRSLFDRRPVRLAVGLAAFGVALAMVATGLRLGRAAPLAKASSSGPAWLVLLAAGLAGGIAGSWAVIVVHRHSMRLPSPERPLPLLVIDRTVSEVPLAIDGFTDKGGGLGYGLLEQWIPRLGYVTTRRSGPAAFSGDVLVVISPTRSVPEDYRQRLVQYVEQGGKLLVIDAIGSPGTTANSLLQPFGMSVRHSTSRQGVLALADGWPALAVEGACEIVGGEPFAWVDSLPVAARKRHGQGEVMAVGFGLEWNDRSFGGHWMREPTPEEKQRFDLFFATVRALVGNTAVRSAEPPSRPQEARRYPTRPIRLTERRSL